MNVFKRVCVCVRRLTWAAQVHMLVFIVGAAPQAPGVVGQGKKVLLPRRVGYGPVQTLQPLLALLERGEVASEEAHTHNTNRMEGNVLKCLN